MPKTNCKSVIAFPEEYVVVDIETTGLNAYENHIIEISALKYRNQKMIDRFVTFVNPNVMISSFITNLTGITDEMVEKAPYIEEVIDLFHRFVKDEIIVGYNVGFDIGFLDHNLRTSTDEYLTNAYVDVLRIARRTLPYLSHHRQTDIAQYYGISIQGAHRAEKDCLICEACYEHLQKDIQKKMTLDAFCKSTKKLF